MLVLGPVLALLLALHPTPGDGLLALVQTLPPLFLAVFLVFFLKSGCDLDTFNAEFHHVSPYSKAVVSLCVMASFVLVEVGTKGPDISGFAFRTLATTMALGVLEKLKLHRSSAGDWAQVRHSPDSVAWGLARAFQSFLSNVLAGVPGVSLPHTLALHDYLEKQGLEQGDLCWVSAKVIVFFPESERIKDSVEDFLLREKDSGAAHCVVSETVRHQYEVAGQMRTSVLHLVKVKHGGQGGWRNNYLIFVENRPLIALHQVSL